MATLISNQTEELPPPPAGRVAAVCVDVIDKGRVKTKWGVKSQIRIVFEIDALKENGSPFYVGQTYTASLHEMSRLRKDLQSWRRCDLSERELAEGFDPDSMIGRRAELVLAHEKGSNGKTYAVIKEILAGGYDKFEASGKYEGRSGGAV